MAKEKKKISQEMVFELREAFEQRENCLVGNIFDGFSLENPYQRVKF